MDNILYKTAEFFREENASLTENLLVQATEELQSFRSGIFCICLEYNRYRAALGRQLRSQPSAG